jgi:hypothetical protein
MNSKKAKLLRKTGKVDKNVKKLYNTLDWREKTILSEAYKDIIATVDK